MHPFRLQLLSLACRNFRIVNSRAIFVSEVLYELITVDRIGCTNDQRVFAMAVVRGPVRCGSSGKKLRILSGRDLFADALHSPSLGETADQTHEVSGDFLLFIELALNATKLTGT